MVPPLTASTLLPYRGTVGSPDAPCIVIVSFEVKGSLSVPAYRRPPLTKMTFASKVCSELASVSLGKMSVPSTITRLSYGGEISTRSAKSDGTTTLSP